MTRKQFHCEYILQTGDGHHNGQCWKQFRNYIQQNDISWSDIRFWKEQKMIEGKNITATELLDRMNCIAPLQTATCTTLPSIWWDGMYPKQEEGINPMYASKTAYTTTVPTGDLTINLAPAASASVSTKSDVAIQRDYLMQRWSGISSSLSYGKIRNDLREKFNLDVDNSPKTSQALVDAIKAGKFKLDDRILKLQAAGEDYDEANDTYVGSIFAAFTWDGPTPDRTGYEAAYETFDGLLKSAKDTIIVKSPDEGLAAIQALEAWTPTGKAN